MRSVPLRGSGGSVEDSLSPHNNPLKAVSPVNNGETALSGSVEDSLSPHNNPLKAVSPVNNGVESKPHYRQTHRYRVVVLTSSRRCARYMTTGFNGLLRVGRSHLESRSLRNGT